MHIFINFINFRYFSCLLFLFTNFHFSICLLRKQLCVEAGSCLSGSKCLLCNENLRLNPSTHCSKQGFPQVPTTPAVPHIDTSICINTHTPSITQYMSTNTNNYLNIYFYSSEYHDAELCCSRGYERSTLSFVNR